MKLYSIVKTTLAAILLLAVVMVANAQGVTTSTINGRITGDDGEGLIGANVLATHGPSGTVYGISTDLDGYYRIPGMRIGGPYKITMSYTGFEDVVKEGIYLTLGQGLQINQVLRETAVELEGVVVTSSRSDIFDGNRTGQETIVDERAISTLPTVTRSLADFTRLNPLVAVNESNSDGFSFTVGGQNNRYNAIFIDGSVNNDQFGLAGSGVDGGQTGAGPVSIDAIEQIQVQAAPFDVRLSGFAGGAVNAVTRSGTNEFEGSAYYFLRNESLTGKTPNNELEDDQRIRFNDFTANTYGARLAGPIIKNKLFFFANVELQRDETPEPFRLEDYNGDATAQDLAALEDKLKEFGYDPGTFTDNATTLDRNFFIAKLDWNINQNHKLSLRHLYNDIENLEARNSSPSGIRYQNGSEFFPSTTNNTTLELNSIFGSNLSNNFKLGVKFVRDDRDPFGTEFPWVEITDGEGEIEFGGERFSSANRLDQDVITLTNDFSIFKGKHNITIGTQNEFTKVGNLFIRENFGAYRYFDGLDQFLNDEPSSQFDRTFSQVDNVTGDESQAIAEFNFIQLGLYIQDEIQVSDNFKFTAGLRFDLPIFPDDVPENREFNNSTIPAIEALYGEGILEGARTGQFINSQVYVSPRVGFNWDVKGDRQTQLRGGAGIFLSRQPAVWFGGAYNNYGFNISGTRLRNEVVFNPDINNQPPGNVDLNNPTPGGQIDLFAEDFRLPSVLKVDVAVDQRLPWGLIGTAEVLYTKNLNNVFYKSLNLRPSTETLEGTGDNRPIFNVFDEIDDTYTGVFLGTNTSKGYAFNIVGSLMKPFTNGFTGTLSYSYGDAQSINDGTSSQNNSQWRGYVNPLGRNFERDAARSQYSVGSRIFSTLSYRKEYGGFGATTITLAYEGRSGLTFTHVVDANGFGAFINDGAFNDSDPVYVPRDRNDIVLVDTDGFTADQQWAILDQYINDNDDLADNRGGYAEINGARTPFTNLIDLKVAQEFYIENANGKRNTLEITLDIFNFTNLLGNLFDSDWGRIYSNSFANFNLLRFDSFQQDGEGNDTNIPTYTVSTPVLNGENVWDRNIVDTGRIRSSRWTMQLGFRYSFGQ